MAAPFKKTTIRHPRVREEQTSDTIHWKALEVPVTKKEYGAVTCIDFCPVEPYNFVVTNSTKLQIYSNRTNQILQTVSRFEMEAYSGCFRNDGGLLAAGGQEGVLRIFDGVRKVLLRTLKGHNDSVRVTNFLTDNIRLFSGSDDKSFRIWDIATGSEICSFFEHEDYIRCGKPSAASHDIVLSGGYDHLVKLYDTRIDKSVLTVDHGHPVESVLMFPSGGIFLSAGGTVIKVWDAFAGGKLITQLSHHHKTITSLGFCSNYRRLLSGSLDRHVKIYDVGTYQVVHTLDYPGSILSLGVSPDDCTVVVGAVDGLLSIQHRKPDNEKTKKASYKYSVGTKKYLPQEDDVVIEHKKREMLAQYDKYFKKFNHSKALDAALDCRVAALRPEVTVCVMQELIRRNAIKPALAGRDEKSLRIILKFLQKNISNPNFMTTLIDIGNILLDIYSSRVGQSSVVDDLLGRLKETVDAEIKFMKMLSETMGTMETIFAASESISLNHSLQNKQESTLLKPYNTKSLN